jgi:putative tryptophan/tyrosine transport system substrate-binding protein
MQLLGDISTCGASAGVFAQPRPTASSAGQFCYDAQRYLLVAFVLDGQFSMRRRNFIALLGGAAATWPFAMNAQQSLPVVGFLSSRSSEESAHLVEAFRDGLKDGGFIEGQSVSLEFRWARGDYGRLPALAAELVNRRVTVIAAVGGDPSNKAAKQATATIPIVFATGSDPVQAGLVQSFNRPGGNATGVTTSTNLMEPKRLGLLRELAPGVSLVGALVNPNFPAAVRQAADIEQAARTVGQRILIANASTDDGLEAAFASFVRGGVGALLVTADPYFDVRRDRIVAFAARQRLPAIYQFREFAVAGGILSYGLSFVDVYRQVGVYTAKILNGAKPAELPVQQVTKFELIINMKTAKTLGISISDNLLSLADEVIE